MTRILRLVALATVLVVLALSVMACGGDDADTTTSEAPETPVTETSETTTTQAPETTVTEAPETTTTQAAETTTTTQAPATTTTAASSSQGTLLDVISSNSSLSTLAKAIQDAGLASRLDDPDAELTVFAPTNDAFKAALSDWGVTLDQLLSFPDLTYILTYHVVPEVITRGDINRAGGEQITVGTVAGEDLIVVVSDGGDIYVGKGKAMVTKADIPASNGVVHVIDGALLPPGLDF